MKTKTLKEFRGKGENLEKDDRAVHNGILWEFLFRLHLKSRNPKIFHEITSPLFFSSLSLKLKELSVTMSLSFSLLHFFFEKKKKQQLAPTKQGSKNNSSAQ